MIFKKKKDMLLGSPTPAPPSNPVTHLGVCTPHLSPVPATSTFLITPPSLETSISDPSA